MNERESVIVTVCSGVKIYANLEEHARDAVDGAWERDVNDAAEEVVSQMFHAGR